MPNTTRERLQKKLRQKKAEEIAVTKRKEAIGVEVAALTEAATIVHPHFRAGSVVEFHQRYPHYNQPSAKISGTNTTIYNEYIKCRAVYLMQALLRLQQHPGTIIEIIQLIGHGVLDGRHQNRHFQGKNEFSLEDNLPFILTIHEQLYHLTKQIHHHIIKDNGIDTTFTWLRVIQNINDYHRWLLLNVDECHEMIKYAFKNQETTNDKKRLEIIEQIKKEASVIYMTNIWMMRIFSSLYIVTGQEEKILAFAQKAKEIERKLDEGHYDFIFKKKTKKRTVFDKKMKLEFAENVKKNIQVFKDNAKNESSEVYDFEKGRKSFDFLSSLKKYDANKTFDFSEIDDILDKIGKFKDIEEEARASKINDIYSDIINCFESLSHYMIKPDDAYRLTHFFYIINRWIKENFPHEKIETICCYQTVRLVGNACLGPSERKDGGRYFFQALPISGEKHTNTFKNAMLTGGQSTPKSKDQKYTVTAEEIIKAQQEDLNAWLDYHLQDNKSKHPMQAPNIISIDPNGIGLDGTVEALQRIIKAQTAKVEDEKNKEEQARKEAEEEQARKEAEQARLKKEKEAQRNINRYLAAQAKENRKKAHAHKQMRGMEEKEAAEQESQKKAAQRAEFEEQQLKLQQEKDRQKTEKNREKRKKKKARKNERKRAAQKNESELSDSSQNVPVVEVTNTVLNKKEKPVPTSPKKAHSDLNYIEETDAPVPLAPKTVSFNLGDYIDTQIQHAGMQRKRRIPPLPKDLASLMSRVEEKGFIIYVVGGAVRDALLKLDHFRHDVDIVTNCPPEILSELTRQSVRKNNKVKQVNLSIFEYKGMSIDWVYDPNLDLQKDARMRDVTINALYCNSKGKILDPLGTFKSISMPITLIGKNKEQRFSEDPVKILRVIELSMRLNRPIEPETKSALKASCAELAKLPYGALQKHLSKLLIQPNPHEGLKRLLDMGAYAVIFGEAGANILKANPAIIEKMAAEIVRRYDDAKSQNKKLLFNYILYILLFPQYQHEIAQTQHGIAKTQHEAEQTDYVEIACGNALGAFSERYDNQFYPVFYRHFKADILKLEKKVNSAPSSPITPTFDRQREQGVGKITQQLGQLNIASTKKEESNPWFSKNRPF